MNNPAGAVALAKMAIKQVPPPFEVNTVSDLFLQRNMVREATAFLLDALADDKPEQGALQTKLLEINLVTNPQVADAILANGTLNHYDRPRVAQLCEKAGLYTRALQVGCLVVFVWCFCVCCCSLHHHHHSPSLTPLPPKHTQPHKKTHLNQPTLL